MENNLNIFQQVFDNLKGELVICDFKVYRLIGIVEDEIDYYYCLFDGEDLYFYSCLIDLIKLKDQIEDEDYQKLISSVKLNHPDLSNDNTTEELLELINEFKKEIISSINEDKKFIVGPYWELN